MIDISVYPILHYYISEAQILVVHESIQRQNINYGLGFS